MLHRIALLMIGPLAAATTAQAAESSSGNGALVLAAVIGLQSPLVSAAGKIVLGKMLDGDLAFSASVAKIKVQARSVSCRASDVDIAAHACTIGFGQHSTSVKGRVAHEIFATLVENGVPSDGAAGSIFEAVSNLSCTVDPAEVKQRGGGGADCTFQAGPGS